jgi:hypothetical protein
VLPLVALSLVLLMGMAAMVVDIGNGRQIRRQAQGAVDSASLAAVVDYDGQGATQTAATARAIEYVEDNGFLDGNTDILVSFSTSAAGEPCVTVEIRNYPVATFFGRVLGATSLPVTAVATGCQAPNTISVPGLFAGGEQCTGSGKAFTISGNNNRMEGSIHSNLDAKEAGNNNVRISGTTATYVSTPLNVSGAAPLWWLGATQTGQVAWPLTFTISDYQPGGSHAIAAGSNYFAFTGDRSLTGPINSGIYYTTGKWALDSISVNPYLGHTGATFVTNGGAIELNGNNSLIRPFDLETQKLTFFAGWSEKSGGERCDSETMKLSGNCILFDGIAYVPYGKYRASGEGNGHDYNTGSGQCVSQAKQLSHAGGVLAWAIELSGNANLYRGGNVPGGTGSPYLSS